MPINKIYLALVTVLMLQLAAMAEGTKTTEAQFYGCRGWSEYGACEGENCSQKGLKSRKRMCNYGVEWIEYIEYKLCIAECTTTTTTTTTSTTTEAPVTTPEIFVNPVNCLKCAFSHGQNWLPDIFNCHKYYICVPQPNHKFRIFNVDCGELFWSQEFATCVRYPATGCQMMTPSPTSLATSKVTYKTTSKINSKTSSRTTSGTNLKTTTTKYVKPCKQDPMLHFPFDSHFDDVGCSMAKGINYGSGSDIVKNNGKAFACFAGHSHIEVPFMRKWFAGREVTKFTVTLWFKANVVNNISHVGLVHNGDCLDRAGFELGMRISQRRLYAAVTTDLKQSTSKDINSEINKWQFAAWVYDGSNLKVYLNGRLSQTTKATGFMANTDAPLTIGKLCDSCYFSGCIDDVSNGSLDLQLASLSRCTDLINLF